MFLSLFQNSSFISVLYFEHTPTLWESGGGENALSAVNFSPLCV